MNIPDDQGDLRRNRMTSNESAPSLSVRGIITLYHEFGGISVDILRNFGTEKIEVVGCPVNL